MAARERWKRRRPAARGKGEKGVESRGHRVEPHSRRRGAQDASRDQTFGNQFECDCKLGCAAFKIISRLWGDVGHTYISELSRDVFQEESRRVEWIEGRLGMSVCQPHDRDASPNLEFNRHYPHSFSLWKLFCLAIDTWMCTLLDTIFLPNIWLCIH